MLQPLENGSQAPNLQELKWHRDTGDKVQQVVAEEVLSTPRLTVQALLLQSSDAAGAGADTPAAANNSLKRPRPSEPAGESPAAIDALHDVDADAAASTPAPAGGLPQHAIEDNAVANTQSAGTSTERRSLQPDGASPSGTSAAPAPPKLATAYICQLAGKRGRFIPEQAKKLGITPCALCIL